MVSTTTVLVAIMVSATAMTIATAVVATVVVVSTTAIPVAASTVVVIASVVVSPIAVIVSTTAVVGSATVAATSVGCFRVVATRVGVAVLVIVLGAALVIIPAVKMDKCRKMIKNEEGGGGEQALITSVAYK